MESQAARAHAIVETLRADGTRVQMGRGEPRLLLDLQDAPQRQCEVVPIKRGLQWLREQLLLCDPTPSPAV